LQREEETIEGHLRKQRAAVIRRTHRNAQRLLAALPVHNPFARMLTFPDENTRLRRDQKKYLTLIRAIALLHQHQRVLAHGHQQPNASEGEKVKCIEVTLEDIAVANRLAGEVLGRSLDEMPPQTRRFLDLILAAVRRVCAEKQIDQRHYRFTQRDVRGWTNASPQQVKRHLAKLVDLEYALVHRGGRGQSFVYELLYQGEGADGRKFVLGLIDPDKLRSAAGHEARASHYDGNRVTENGHRDTPGTAQVHERDADGSNGQNATSPNNGAGETHVAEESSRKTQFGNNENAAAS
jgi:hypothetical protein